MKKLNSTQSWMTHLLVTVVMTGLMVNNLSAKEAVETVDTKNADQKITQQQIDEWVKGLDSNNPDMRQQAAGNLEKSGAAAIKALTKAADTKNLELSTQCIEILKNMHVSEDAATKKSATASLTKLSESKIQQVAQRAKASIKKVAPVPTDPFGLRGAGLNGVQIKLVKQALAKVKFQNQNAQNNQKERKNVVKEGNKTIEVRETPGEEIVVKVTEKVNGKDKVTETKAKTLIELRKKNKEAYDLYRKHKPKAPARPANPFGNLAGGNVQIMINGGNMSMKQTNKNGQRHTEIEQNGRKIEIDDLNNTNIVVKITETVKGKKKTKEYKAKNLKELKKKHPEAAEEYEKHIKGGGGLPFQIFGGAGNIPPNFRSDIQKIHKQNMENCEKMIREFKERSKKYQGTGS